MQITMKTQLIFILAIAAAGLAVLSFSFVAFGANDGSDSAVEIDLSQIDLLVLSRAQAPGDRQADGAAVNSAGSGGLVSESVRKLGENERASYWAGIDHDDNVCLMFELRNGTTGFGCSPIDLFNREGTGVALEDVAAEEFLEAQLLPDSAVLTGEGPYEQVAPNVIALDSGLRYQGSRTIELPTTSGGTLLFHVRGQAHSG